MKKITNRQMRDIECIKWFIPNGWSNIPITEADMIEFLDYSDRGIVSEERNINPGSTIKDGFTALLHGKRWRGIHIHELWEPGVLEGSVPYILLLGGADKKEIPPYLVVNFMKREMFKGTDSDLIEEVYQSIINE